MSDEGMQAHIDALAAELAAANTRCAELEAENVTVIRLTKTEYDRVVAERDALQARLDRVTALADEWQLCLRDPKRRTGWSGGAVLADLRRALADSGTKDGSNDA